MRIVSYNVRYFGHATRGIASTRRTVQKIAAALASLDPLPGILCLQEVETSSIRSTLADAKRHEGETQLARFVDAFHAALTAADRPARYEAYYFPAHTYRLTKKVSFYTTGLAILAHPDFEIAHHNADAPADITHRHIHAMSGLKQTRVCAHVRFRYQGAHAIDVFNTHLSLPRAMAKEFWTSPKRLGFGKNQLEEARNLVRFVDAERESDRFVVLGDFNSLPTSPVYRYLVEERGLVDAFATTRGIGDEDSLAFPTAGFTALRMHLDHVFTGPGLEWLDFRATRPFGDKTSLFHGLSDHTPMIGRCRVKE